jgi:hypothetical protein
MAGPSGLGGGLTEGPATSQVCKAMAKGQNNFIMNDKSLAAYPVRTLKLLKSGGKIL